MEKRIPLVEQVVDSISKMILSEDLNVGDKMPSEAALCKLCGVSRSTIREALRILQAKGYIEIRSGSGAFLSSKKPNDEYAINWIVDHGSETLDSLEIRSAIEPLAARLAAERAASDDIYSLIGVHALFEQAIRDSDSAKMALYDEVFHAKIAKISHNALLIQTSAIIAKALATFRSNTFIINGGEAACTAHKKIVDAINERDPVRAEQCMIDHLRENIDMAQSYINSIKKTRTK